MKKFVFLFFLLSVTVQAWASPVPPALTYQTNDLNISIFWTDVPGATGYKLFYAPYPFLGEDTIRYIDVEDATAFSINLWEGAAYYVAVTAYDNLGESEYSNIGKFIINRNISSHIAIRFSLASIADITDSFFDISTFSEDRNFKGMMPLFYYYGDDMEDLSSVTLYPPSTILHSNSNTDFDLSFFANQDFGIVKSVAYNPVGVVTIETAYVDRFPEGEWILKNTISGIILGKFFFEDFRPFDDNGVMNGIVPTPRINTDGENNVTSVTLKMNRYDNLGSNLINKESFDAIGKNLHLSYVPNSSQYTQNMRLLAADEEALELTFEAPEGLNIVDLNRMIVGYEIGQAKYQFFFE